MNRDFILKDKLTIYDNRAKSGDSLGRLSVTYDIYPAPAIFWEFETESRAIDLPKYDEKGNLISPFECVYFNLLDPFLYPTDELEAHLSLGRRMTGSTTRAIIGDQTVTGKSFTFFLPNAKFQEAGILGKNFVVKEIIYKKSKETEESEELEEFGGNFREGFLEASIGNGVTLKMQTPIESIDWLRKRRSIGTYITTHGELFVDNDISINDAADLLDDVAFLLSFANGGSIAPLVVKMDQSNFDMEYPTVYTSFAIDPIEHIAGTWLDKQSDIDDLLKCFPSFQKMLQSDHWKDNYWLILMWYFQAIQPSGIQIKGKPWPVVANALGAALEKLASIILVDEQKISKTQFKKLTLEDEIRELLRAIGINNIGPKYDTHDPEHGAQDAVWWFKELRNDATHPKSNRKWTGEEANIILDNAIQWVEEILLWRLGYKGGYSDRSRNNKFIPSPRYKIELRDASW
ncbi:MAG: hypothetical protein HZB18_09825 [Chloroflexi bacterium]|nr:hypothetical protein [Chloroflexota bacterium]